MKWALGLLVASHAFAGPTYKLGEVVANKCWLNAGSAKVCLDDFKGKTVVMLFNAGWCEPCNDEFSQLHSGLDKYAPTGKHDVVFLSLSCDGWVHGDGVTAKFLSEWDKKHGLSTSRATFHVLNSSKDCGRDFFSSPSIPNAAIIAENSKLNFKGIAPGLAKLKQEIDQALKP